MQHKLHTCDEPDCQICLGGHAVCEVCKLINDLPEECAGAPAPPSICPTATIIIDGRHVAGPAPTAQTPEEKARRDALTAKKLLLGALPLTTQAKRLALLREQKSYFESLAEAVGSEISVLGEVFFKTALETDTPSIRVSGSLFTDGAERIVSPDTVYRPTVKDKDKMFAWLRANQLGDMIKESVHPASLEAFVTKTKENNQPLPGENILAVFTVETASVRKAPKAAKKKEKGE